MDLAHGIIVHEAEIADDVDPHEVEEFANFFTSNGRIRERRSGERYVPARDHPRRRTLERSFAVFDDFTVRVERMKDIPLPGEAGRPVFFGRAPTVGHGFAHTVTVPLGAELFGEMSELHRAVGRRLAEGSRPPNFDLDEDCLAQITDLILAKRNCAPHERISLGSLWRNACQRSGRMDPSL